MKAPGDLIHSQLTRNWDSYKVGDLVWIYEDVPTDVLLERSHMTRENTKDKQQSPESKTTKWDQWNFNISASVRYWLTKSYQEPSTVLELCNMTNSTHLEYAKILVKSDNTGNMQTIPMLKEKIRLVDDPRTKQELLECIRLLFESQYQRLLESF